MELGSFLRFQLQDRMRYLKCFRVPTELDNTSKDESLKSSTRKYLNLEMHASTKDNGNSIWKIIVYTLLSFCKGVTNSCHCLQMTDDELFHQ